MYSHLIDIDRQASIETEVTEYMQNNITFSVYEIKSKEERLYVEARIISTISNSNKSSRYTSNDWLGNSSPKNKIQTSGLWQENELWKESLTSEEFDRYFSL